MTRKDFQLIADALRKTRETAKADLHPQAHSMWLVTCMDMAAALATTNPRFNQEKFLKACNPESQSMKISHEIVTKVEGAMGDVINAKVEKIPTLEELLTSMANLAFIVECVAHLQGKEHELLPTAELARRQLAAFKQEA